MKLKILFGELNFCDVNPLETISQQISFLKLEEIRFTLSCIRLFTENRINCDKSVQVFVHVLLLMAFKRKPFISCLFM